MLHLLESGASRLLSEFRFERRFYQKSYYRMDARFSEDGTVHSSRTLCKSKQPFRGTPDGQDLAGDGCPAVYDNNLSREISDHLR